MTKGHVSCANNCTVSLPSFSSTRKNGRFSLAETHLVFVLRFVFTLTVVSSPLHPKRKVDFCRANDHRCLLLNLSLGLESVTVASKKPLKIEALEPGTFEEYKLDENEKAEFVRKERFHAIGTFPKYDVLVKPTGSFRSMLSLTETGVCRLDDVSVNIRSYLINAVTMRLMSHRRIGCMLSGGLDSSLIAALTVQEARRQGITYAIQTFAIGMDEESPDLVAARKVTINFPFPISTHSVVSGRSTFGY